MQYGNIAASPTAPFFAFNSWWRRFVFQILSPREIVIYIYICSLLGRDSLAFPTQTQIAHELGIKSLDIVAKAVRRLTLLGFFIHNTQQVKGFQRTVYQRPAPEFTLIRLLDAKAIDSKLFPMKRNSNLMIEDDLDTTQGAVEAGLSNVLGPSYTTYKAQPLGLRGLLASRFFQRTGISYEESWNALQKHPRDSMNSSPNISTSTLIKYADLLELFESRVLIWTRGSLQPRRGILHSHDGAAMVMLEPEGLLAVADIAKVERDTEI